MTVRRQTERQAAYAMARELNGENPPAGGRFSPQLVNGSWVVTFVPDGRASKGRKAKTIIVDDPLSSPVELSEFEDLAALPEEAIFKAAISGAWFGCADMTIEQYCHVKRLVQAGAFDTPGVLTAGVRERYAAFALEYSFGWLDGGAAPVTPPEADQSAKKYKIVRPLVDFKTTASTKRLKKRGK